jgi:hypothetical protein
MCKKWFSIKFEYCIAWYIYPGLSPYGVKRVSDVEAADVPMITTLLVKAEGGTFKESKLSISPPSRALLESMTPDIEILGMLSMVAFE